MTIPREWIEAAFGSLFYNLRIEKKASLSIYYNYVYE